jgi:predicted secreted Zn-dependent protease
MSDPAQIIWRKSAASETGQCVEVAFVGQRILVRSSDDPSGPMLTFSEPEWTAFLAGVRNGEFDPNPPA